MRQWVNCWTPFDTASALIGFALMVAYWPSFSGLATTPRWDVGALIAVALFFSPAIRMTRTHWLGLALIAWLIASLAWSDGQPYGLDTAWKLLAIVAAFAFGSALADIVPLIAGAAIGLAISSLIATAQWFGWHGIEFQTGSPAGLFWNANRMAEAAVLVLAACLARHMWWALPGLVPAIVMPYDRGAWLTTAIVAAVWIWRRLGGFERFVSAMIAAWVVVGVALLATFWRTEQFGLDAFAERFALWQFTLSNLTWLGHGLGSFAADAPLMAWRGLISSRAAHPHNEYLWMAYEGGLPAVGIFGVFAVLLGRAAMHGERTERGSFVAVGVGGRVPRGAGEGGLGLALLALAILALFAMPFHDPATVLLGALVAGHVARAGRDLRAAADAGGSLLRARDEPGDGDRGRVVGLGKRARALSV
jgi:hypothetical protein